jgi:hypothetical protein
MLAPAEPTMGRSKARRILLGLLLGGVLMLPALTPAAAQAHGAVDPAASSYLARIKTVPRGMRASVVDGDLRLWLEVPSGGTVVVVDYQGAPYLRFSHGRVWANENSVMYYYNLTPPVNPPLGLKRTAPVRWVRVGSGDSYQWHDGRLHASALAAVAPGASYAGSWRIPLLVDGRHAAVSGTLWYRGAPSIAWLWPIAILIFCVLAAWRLHDSRIDTLVARAVAGLTLVGIALGATGRNLHGRPGISIVGVVELTFIMLLTVWTAWRVVRGRAGALTFFLVPVAAVWEAIQLIPTLFNGYVLMAVPPFLGRLATILCVGGAVALVLPAVRLFREEQEHEPSEEQEGEPSEPPANETAPSIA